MRRREFIALLGGALRGWSQQESDSKRNPRQRPRLLRSKRGAIFL
jgi:hypothetical protein